MRLSPTCKEWVVIGLIVSVPICAHFVAVGHWLTLNSPEGKFSNLKGYLASQRAPERVARVRTPHGAYYVAYGSMAGSTLALPSGPPAYVFNDSGSLVYYSKAIGDDSHFHKEWPLGLQEEISLDEIKAKQL